MMAESMSFDEVVTIVRQAMQVTCEKHPIVGCKPDDPFIGCAVENAVRSVLDVCAYGVHDIDECAAAAHDGFRFTFVIWYNHSPQPASRAYLSSHPYHALSLPERLWARTVAGAVLAIGENEV